MIFTVKDILDEMDRIAPLSLMQKGDNSGLLAGLPNDKATKVLAALDITNEVVEEAIAKGADVIISHHPVIYHPLYSLSEENPACRAMKHGIACLCFHSPLDLARGGKYAPRCAQARCGCIHYGRCQARSDDNGTQQRHHALRLRTFPHGKYCYAISCEAFFGGYARTAV